jgi:Na+/proline symporter
MVSGWTLFAISTGYVAVLFAVAYVGDRRARVLGPPARKPWVYSLALCVYCTSWTFYGAVGRAAGSGWDFLPIYLGPVLVFLFGSPLLARIIRISKRHNITSIADFVGARVRPTSTYRYAGDDDGRRRCAAIHRASTQAPSRSVLRYCRCAAGDAADRRRSSTIATMLAAFAILFGTRTWSARRITMAWSWPLPSRVAGQIGGILAVGIYATLRSRDGIVDAYCTPSHLPQYRCRRVTWWRMGFVSQTLLAALAIICLPRQFHVAVVENTSLSDLRTSRWVFPLYLAIISIFVLPIAAAGLERFSGAPVAADTFVLALPLAADHRWLALGAYFGGFSAATGMVIVETIALSTMICNEIVMPMLLRSKRLNRLPGQDLSGLIKLVRRVAIVAIVALAYVYFRLHRPGTPGKSDYCRCGGRSLRLASSGVGGAVATPQSWPDGHRFKTWHTPCPAGILSQR